MIFLPIQLHNMHHVELELKNLYNSFSFIHPPMSRTKVHKTKTANSTQINTKPQRGDSVFTWFVILTTGVMIISVRCQDQAKTYTCLTYQELEILLSATYEHLH